MYRKVLAGHLLQSPGPETIPCRTFTAEFLFCTGFQTYPRSQCWQSHCCILPDTVSHEVFYSWHIIIRDLWVENSPCISNSNLISIFNTCSAVCLSPPLAPSFWTLMGWRTWVPELSFQPAFADRKRNHVQRLLFLVAVLVMPPDPTNAFRQMRSEVMRPYSQPFGL